MVHLGLLRRTLKRRLGRTGERDTRAWLAVIPASLASAAVLALLSGWVRTMAAGGFLGGAGAVAGVSVLALLAFFVLFHTTGGRGARSMVRMVLRRGP
jgi:hypothetical protein